MDTIIDSRPPPPSNSVEFFGNPSSRQAQVSKSPSTVSPVRPVLVMATWEIIYRGAYLFCRKASWEHVWELWSYLSVALWDTLISLWLGALVCHLSRLLAFGAKRRGAFGWSGHDILVGLVLL